MQQIPKYHIFLETSEQIQINDGYSSHLDIHQEGQDDQECPLKYEDVLDGLMA